MNFELKEKWLEQTLDQEKTLPLIVIDYKVYAHQIHNFTESAVDIVGEDESKLRAVVRALWAYRLNRGIDSLPARNFTAIVVDDFKGEIEGLGQGYWRHLEAHKLGLPEYKGGRPPKPSLFPIILEEGYKYIKSPGSSFRFFSKELYEADDVAGKIARIQRSLPSPDRYILLSTLDGDWQGLVSDKHKIVWCNTGPWLPRIRTEEDVCDYYLRKEKLKIGSARETYTVKVEVGDRGDNLLPNTPLRFFDLYEEDEEWGWTEEEETLLSDILSDQSQSNRPDHLTNARKFLTAIGMFLPEIPAPAEVDIALYAERSRKERREALAPDLKGLSKKYCIALPDDNDFVKCSRVAIDDLKALEKIKLLEEKKKSDPANFSEGDKGLLKTLKQSRKDYKATLLRFDAKMKTLGLAH
jgi:hypothetical protein